MAIFLLTEGFIIGDSNFYLSGNPFIIIWP